MGADFSPKAGGRRRGEKMLDILVVSLTDKCRDLALPTAPDDATVDMQNFKFTGQCRDYPMESLLESITE